MADGTDTPQTGTPIFGSLFKFHHATTDPDKSGVTRYYYKFSSSVSLVIVMQSPASSKVKGEDQLTVFPKKEGENSEVDHVFIGNNITGPGVAGRVGNFATYNNYRSHGIYFNGSSDSIIDVDDERKNIKLHWVTSTNQPVNYNFAITKTANKKSNEVKLTIKCGQGSEEAIYKADSTDIINIDTDALINNAKDFKKLDAATLEKISLGQIQIDPERQRMYLEKGNVNEAIDGSIADQTVNYNPPPPGATIDYNSQEFSSSQTLMGAPKANNSFFPANIEFQPLNLATKAYQKLVGGNKSNDYYLGYTVTVPASKQASPTYLPSEPMEAENLPNTNGASFVYPGQNTQIIGNGYKNTIHLGNFGADMQIDCSNAKGPNILVMEAINPDANNPNLDPNSHRVISAQIEIKPSGNNAYTLVRSGKDSNGNPVELGTLTLKNVTQIQIGTGSPTPITQMLNVTQDPQNPASPGKNPPPPPPGGLRTGSISQKEFELLRNSFIVDPDMKGPKLPSTYAINNTAADKGNKSELS